MADIFDKINYEDTPQNGAGDVFDTVSKGSSAKDIAGIVGGTIGMGALGYGAYRAGKGAVDWWQKPQRLIKPIESELDIIRQRNPSWKGTNSPDIPSLISGKAQEVKIIGQSRIKDFTDRSIKSQNILKDRAAKLDNIIKSSTGDLAETIKADYPRFLKDTYKGYEAGLDGIETFMADSKVQFKNTDIANLLEESFSDAIKEGIPENKLGNVRKLINELSPTSPVNETLIEKPISFKQAKGYIKNIINDLPVEAQHRVAERWGQFLETAAPPQVKGELQVLNKAYKPFAEVRNTLSPFIKERMGIFNRKGVTDYISRYLKGRINTGTEELMKMLGEGNELATPISGVKEKFKSIQQLNVTKQNIEQAAEKTVISRQLRTAKMQSAIRAKVEELLTLKNKADVLVSKRAEIMGKYPKRTKGLARAATIVGESIVSKSLGRAIFPMAVGTQAIDALKFAVDPDKYIMELNGIPTDTMPPKGTIQRDKWIQSINAPIS